MIYNTISNEKENILKSISEHGYLTGKEVAGLLKCHERTIIRWRRAREKGLDVGIPFIKIEKKFIYTTQDVIAYLEKNKC